MVWEINGGQDVRGSTDSGFSDPYTLPILKGFSDSKTGFSLIERGIPLSFRGDRLPETKF